jgi:hypothetical protein
MFKLHWFQSKVRFSGLRLTSILLGMCVVVSQLAAQGGHYWGEQYGTRSTLLGNSVIGGVEDLGAVYYNPGRLALTDKPAFLLSADIYEWTQFTVKGVVGDNQSLSKSDIGSVPGFLAGTFRIKSLPKHHFAYALLHSVVNFGIGVELYIRENLPIYSSFNTDFSSVKDDPLAFTENSETAYNGSI